MLLFSMIDENIHLIVCIGVIIV